MTMSLSLSLKIKPLNVVLVHDGFVVVWLLSEGDKFFHFFVSYINV